MKKETAHKKLPSIIHHHHRERERENRERGLSRSRENKLFDKHLHNKSEAFLWREEKVEKQKDPICIFKSVHYS